MKRFLLALFLLAGSLLAAADFSVYLAPDATPAEENAARELVNGLHRIFAPAGSSNMFVLSRKEPEKCLFWVGQSKEAAQALGMKDFSLLKPDEILLKKVNGRILLLGDRPRGTLYAVYEFLERAYGVRFWTAEVEHWPRYKKFFLPGIDRRYAPVFRRRYIYYDLARKSPFCVKLRTNRYGSDPKWGGREEIIGFVHTFGRFVPAKKYFRDHPEWFALRGGKRVPDCQPCLTSRGFRKTLLEAALAALRKQPDPRVISITQNDGEMTFCECAGCTGFIRKHGNKSDLLMDVVNEVAGAVAREFPKVRVETLAYSITLDPPVTVAPRKNVLIRFCPSRADNSQPMDSPANASKSAPFKVWRKFGNPLAVWTYETDFKRFYLPFPNWRGLLHDLRFYADQGVIDVFQQGSYAGPAADLSDLRVWVLGKLQWDPYQDPEALVKEFAEGFYGKAAPHILAYIRHMTATARKGRNRMFPFEFEAPALLRAREILLQGERSVAADPVLRQRLRLALLPVDLALLQLPEVWETPPPALKGVKWQELLEEKLALLKAAKVKRLAEAAFTPEMLKRSIALGLSWEKGPPPVPGYPAGTRWKQVAAADCLRFGPYRFADEPAVPGGRVVEVDCTHRTWTSQLRRPPAGVWEVYVDLRCSGKDPAGTVATFGCYDVERRKSILHGSVEARKVRGPRWRLVKIGRLVSSDDCFLYCAPAVNQSAEKLQIGRYVFIKAE